MTALLLALVLVQAATLLWASMRLSDVFMQRGKTASLMWFVGTIALPLAIAWWGRENDPRRLICGWGDCVALIVSVAFVRFWAINKEEEQFLLEQNFARQAAADKAEATRKAQEAERIQAATAALEARKSELKPQMTNPAFGGERLAPSAPQRSTRPPGAPNHPAK